MLGAIGLITMMSAVGTQIPCHCIAYTAAGILDGVGGNTTLRILDLRTGLRTDALFQGNISHVQGLPNERVGFVEYDNRTLDLFTYATIFDPWTGETQRYSIRTWQRRNAPVWSFDGQYFAYTDEAKQLRIVTTETGAEDVVTDLKGLPLVWSSDNEQLLFMFLEDIIASGGYVHEIYSLDLATGEQRLYWEPPQETFFDYRQFIADWSPVEPSLIAYSFNDAPHIYDTTTAEALPISEQQGLVPRWSTNGDLAYFEFEEITVQRLLIDYRNGTTAQFLLDDMYFLNHFDWLQP